MRFGYPIAATEENWVHDTIVTSVTRIHEIIAAKGKMPEWPLLLPENRREALTSRHGLKAKLAAYMKAARKLTPAERELVMTTMAQQNQIADLLAGQANCDCITALPVVIQEPVKELFEAGFDLLESLGIRDDHYTVIWNAIPDKVCPFCCQEALEAPGITRPDLDHSLARTDYPFAAANLRNLVPMGQRCNQRYKGVQQLMLNAEGHRRRAFYPYSEVRADVQFSLVSSVPFGSADQKLPRWQIDFEQDCEECRTWDAVFRLKERFEKNILDPEYPRWLGDFSRWFARTKGRQNLEQHVIVAALEEFSESEAIQGHWARDFLRVLTYKMLHRHCAQGHQRLIADLQARIQNTYVPVGN